MTWRRVSVLAAAAGLAAASCGGGSDTMSAPDANDPVTDASASVEPPTDESATNPADGSAGDTPTTGVPDEPRATGTPATDPVTAESAATPTPGTDAPAVDAEAGSSPESTSQPGGRSFATEVRPEAQFEENPFPDLVVADVGKRSDANIANVLPADRPILLWAWAPH